MLNTLPQKSAPLSNAGMQKLLEIVKNNPSLAQSVANEIENNPREAIFRYFRLTTPQQSAITNSPDDRLKIRVAPLVAALRNEVFDGIKYDPGSGAADDTNPDHPGGGPGGDVMWKCTCSVTIEN